MSETNYIAENEYTLSEVKSNIEAADSYGSRKTQIVSKLTRSFNFLSAQTTTTLVERIFEPRGHNSGGSASVSTEMHIENFREVQSNAEIFYMHKKLIELGGNPPKLKSIDFSKGIQKPILAKTPPTI